MRCSVEPAGEVVASNGVTISAFRLRAGPCEALLLDAGCAIARLEVPDRHGNTANVVLGYDDLREYLGARREYFGAVAGRVANRIAQGRFSLNGCEHRLATNDGANHLHGGHVGFSHRAWRAVDGGSSPDRAHLAFELRSDDGEEGYPGTLQARVTYELRDDGTLHLLHEATCDAPTVVNLTNHSYFNLAGHDAGDVLGHELQIAADAYCEVATGLIPSGGLCEVAGTPFDFREPRAVGDRLGAVDLQLALAGGYDHCFALRDWDAAPVLRDACTLVHRPSGRRLRVATDRPGVQFYSGNFLDGTAAGPGGIRYPRHAGLCLETQAFPDAPHHAHFPSIELAPGEHLRTETVWRFDVLP